MCGISGKYTINKKTDYVENSIRLSLKKLVNRGPDDLGIKKISSLKSVLVLGHRRLSIIDLSEGGKQPMTSKSGRFTIIFNGEIYNYLELREILKNLGYIFTTSSDTEVLLTAWEHWGEECIAKLVGMFAFAIYDENSNQIFLVRDAFGIKPLFYQLKNKTSLSFSSELPALLELIDEKLFLNKQAAFDYLIGERYDLSEKTFYESILSLMPGEFIKFNLNDLTISKRKKWWKPSIKENTQISFKEASKKIREQFLENINLHMRSDVNIGTALSGGIDSSSIVCAMRYLKPNIDIHTFTYIAEGSKLNEEKWADKINQHVDAISHKIKINPLGITEEIDDLIESQGAPFASTSTYAQYKVFEKIKKEKIKVILDGQGADEILAGYPVYIGSRIKSLLKNQEFFRAFNLFYSWNKNNNLNKKSSLQIALRPFLSDQLIREIKTFKNKNFNPIADIDWFNRNGIRGLESENLIDFEEYNIPERQLSLKLLKSIKIQGLIHLLRQEDRTSMRWSIESRVPFLTTSFVDLCLSMPESYIISDKGESKHIFKDAMRGIVPSEVLNRKDKIGFETPENKILKDLIPEFLKEINYFSDLPLINKKFIRKIKNKNISNYSDLWRVINFCKWYKIFSPSL